MQTETTSGDSLVQVQYGDTHYGARLSALSAKAFPLLLFESSSF